MNINESYEYYFNKYGVGTHQLHTYNCIMVTNYDVIFYTNSDGSNTHTSSSIWHRLDGPTIIERDGHHSWYINDQAVTDEITKWASDNYVDLDNLSEDDKLLIKLVWADYGK